MVSLTEIFLPEKSTTTTYYDESDDPWFKRRFRSTCTAEASVNIDLFLENFGKLKESLDVAEQNAREEKAMRYIVRQEMMMMKAMINRKAQDHQLRALVRS